MYMYSCKCKMQNAKLLYSYAQGRIILELIVDSAVHQAEAIGCLTFKCTRGFLAGPSRPTHDHARGVEISARAGRDVEDSGCVLRQVPLGAQPPQNVQELFFVNSHEPLRVPHGLGISPQWDHPGCFWGLASLPPPPTKIWSPGTIPLITNHTSNSTKGYQNLS